MWVNQCASHLTKEPPTPRLLWSVGPVLRMDRLEIAYVPWARTQRGDMAPKPEPHLSDHVPQARTPYRVCFWHWGWHCFHSCWMFWSHPLELLLSLTDLGVALCSPLRERSCCPEEVNHSSSRPPLPENSFLYLSWPGMALLRPFPVRKTKCLCYQKTLVIVCPSIVCPEHERVDWVPFSSLFSKG